MNIPKETTIRSFLLPHWYIIIKYKFVTSEILIALSRRNGNQTMPAREHGDQPKIDTKYINFCKHMLNKHFTQNATETGAILKLPLAPLLKLVSNHKKAVICRTGV